MDAAADEDEDEDEDEEADEEEDVSAFVDVGGMDAVGPLCWNHCSGWVSVS